MAQFLTPYQAWCDDVRRAIDTDQSLPIPEGSPAMTLVERQAWQTHVRQTIHHDSPVLPFHWLQQQAARRSAPTSLELWGDVAKARLARLAGQDGDGGPGAA